MRKATTTSKRVDLAGGIHGDMGHNVDLTQMLGLPAKVICPRCGKKTSSWFDDYDIDCGDPNPKPGEWELDVCCLHCDCEFTASFSVGRVEQDIE